MLTTFAWRDGEPAEVFDDPRAAVPRIEGESEMGNWNITINGTGAHHNADNPGDADKRFKEFVAKLKEDGHNVEQASFTYGARETLIPGQ